MIRVEWIRWNSLNCKQIENDVVKKVFSGSSEIDLENIKSIYVSFDRNEREKRRRIWITNFQGKEKRVELLKEKYKILKEICK